MNSTFRDFNSARKFARNLKLSSARQWRKYVKSGKKPEDIPANPDKTYKNKGWKGFPDFLGYERIATIELSKQYLPFKEARGEARKLAKQYNIKNWEDWKNAVNKGLIPKNIPANPNWTYGKKRKKDGKRNN